MTEAVRIRPALRREGRANFRLCYWFAHASMGCTAICLHPHRGASTDRLSGDDDRTRATADAAVGNLVVGNEQVLRARPLWRESRQKQRIHRLAADTVRSTRWDNQRTTNSTAPQ